MARIRSIKPEFWTDERVTECSLSARLLFIGLWNFADDCGNIQMIAKQIKAKVFPCDNIKVESLLQDLIDNGLLTLYSAMGSNYLHINGFAKHQKIDHPSAPQHPEFVLPENSSSNTRVLGECSLLKGSDLKGREGIEGIGKEGIGARAHSFASSPFFDITVLQSQNPDWPEEKTRHYHQAAADYSAAKGKRYHDWAAAIRNWARKDEQDGKKPWESRVSIVEQAAAIERKYVR